MVTIQTYIPVTLSRIVKSFWWLKVCDSVDGSHVESILPDGHHEIIFHLSSGNAKRKDNNSEWIKEPDSFFAGQTLNSYSLELQNNSYLYGIRFHPHTLGFLFGFPADLITNNILELHEISQSRALINCISENPEKTFKNFETVLLQLFDRICFSANKFQYIEYSVREILQNKGDIRIDRLLIEAGISQKYFDKLFRHFVGINPKPFCNIIKLNNFINYRKKNYQKKLTECCYEAGFFDQSHLIKLFSTVTGQSPKRYFNNSNQINNYFSEL